MQKINKFTYTLAILTIVLFVIFSSVGGGAAVSHAAIFANAQSLYGPTDVLDDLRKDTSFNPDNYPEDTSDNSLKLIQLAESVNKELFVYVYQPSGKSKDFKASSINISTTINDSLSYHNYKLEFLNSDGVFYKYKVKDFTVKTYAVRYYVITSIYRPFEENIDEPASGDNTVPEVPFAVNKQYCFGEINGKPYVNCVDIDTIVVTDKFVGFVRYKDGFKLYTSACDSHFVAFDTDKPIDKLFEAEVYYTTQSYSWSFVPLVGEKEEFGDKEDKYSYPKYTDKVEHAGDGLFAGTYTWDRIQTVDDFIANENKDNIYSGAVFNVTYGTKLTDEVMSSLKGKKWVLRFTETDYTVSSYSTGSTIENSTLVGDVTILRLKFETDGITYNLGVIDNKQSGSKDPSNETDIDITLNDNGKKILALIMLFFVIILLAPFLPYVFKMIVWVVSLPFKAIAALIKAVRHSANKKK